MSVWTLGLAALAVALMGYAIQRGGTCTVAAVEELLARRRATRLVAMAEAALWVAGGLALLHALGRLPATPRPYAVGAGTVAGGLLLGLGAWVNRACVFGAIARFGSGEWAYAATPAGYFAGCLGLAALPGLPAAARLDTLSPLLQAALPVALLFAAGALWRVAPVLRRPRQLAERVWAPHAATGVIGVTFLVALLAAGGTWAYTDVLAELAAQPSSVTGAAAATAATAGPPMNLPSRLLLFGMLLAGAALGGWTAGRWRARAPRAAELARCFAGGVLMAWGSGLIPGANDGLILIGLPLLWPYAWLGVGCMALAIAAARALQRAWRPAGAEAA